jgi:hypothetical protein
MYLLCQDDVLHPDGTTTTPLPLTISLGEGDSAFVAFGTPQTARAFLRRFPMGPDYRVVPLSRVPRTKLYVTDHLFLMRTVAAIEAFVLEGTGPHLRDRLISLGDLFPAESARPSTRATDGTCLAASRTTAGDLPETRR